MTDDYLEKYSACMVRDSFECLLHASKNSHVLKELRKTLVALFNIEIK